MNTAETVGTKFSSQNTADDTTDDTASPQDTQSATGTESDCEQTTGELQVIASWLDGSANLSKLSGVRVTISGEDDAPFTGILEEDAQLTIDLSPGEYAVRSSDSSTGYCLEALTVSTTVTACERSTATLAFQQLGGC